jgi:hypothetical protein
LASERWEGGERPARETTFRVDGSISHVNIAYFSRFRSYYAQLSVGTPRQKDIHVILDTGSSVFAIFAVPHGGPSALVIFLLIAALILGLAAVGLMILSW